MSSGEYFPMCQRIVVHLQGQAVKEDLNINSSWSACFWRCQLLLIQQQSTAFQETCIISSTTMRMSDRACEIW